MDKEQRKELSAKVRKYIESCGKELETKEKRQIASDCYMFYLNKGKKERGGMTSTVVEENIPKDNEQEADDTIQ